MSNLKINQIVYTILSSIAATLLIYEETQSGKSKPLYISNIIKWIGNIILPTLLLPAHVQSMFQGIWHLIEVRPETDKKVKIVKNGYIKVSLWKDMDATERWNSTVSATLMQQSKSHVLECVNFIYFLKLAVVGSVFLIYLLNN